MRHISRSFGIFSAAVLAALTSICAAQDTNDPEIRGNDNRAWGEAINDLAKREDSEVKGHGMGAHSRSTRAANNVGGFANDDNGFGIEFNVKEDGEDAGREGVGNVSKGELHNTHPGDGGNGQHARNNVAASSVLDPVTGEPVQ